jgi:hypothetical protein
VTHPTPGGQRARTAVDARWTARPGMRQSASVMDPEVISCAVVVWTGYGDTAIPDRDPARVVEVYGASAAADLLPVLERLASDFYESDAHNLVAGLDEMGVRASARFRVRHPELSAEDRGIRLVRHVGLEVGLLIQQWPGGRRSSFCVVGPVCTGGDDRA